MKTRLVMLYKKPEKLKYTTMAIYIDEHIYSDDYDPELVYKYIYFISSMLAHKYKLFNVKEDYEDFLIDYSTQVYMRLVNKKQFEYDNSGNPKLKKVKSVLNYIKNTIRLRAYDFVQTNTSKIELVADPVPQVDSVYYFGNTLTDYVDKFNRIEFESCLQDIIKSVRKYLEHIPYKKNTVEFINIYISCLLSFLNSISLSKQERSRLESLETRISSDFEQVETFYRKNSEESIILYHLDDSFYNYIKVLTTGIKHYIAQELSWSGRTYTPTASVSRSLLVAEMSKSDAYKDMN